MLLPPVRCWSCQRLLGHAYAPYDEAISQGQAAKPLMDRLGLRLMCCRRMVQTQPRELAEGMFAQNESPLDHDYISIETDRAAPVEYDLLLHGRARQGEQSS